ncbi:VOC family protein [Aquisediminimonas sediminicola]|uniref:VOC family protein n=1 Tax=Alteraquisediminimonas sediminicola TaxID=2676787 RepID=UPI001FE758EE|nr:VOC family protein [Aquisediminimonas sediminicola]
MMDHPLAARCIDHVVLRVVDVPLMTAFYIDVLGCVLDWHRPELGLTHLRAGSALIDLVDIAGPLGGEHQPSGLNVDHICLLLQHFDEGRIRAHLTQHKVACGETAERYGALGMGPSMYVHDPEGNMIELKGAGGDGSRHHDSA